MATAKPPAGEQPDPALPEIAAEKGAPSAALRPLGLVYTQLGPVEEVNGLFTYDRAELKPKSRSPLPVGQRVGRRIWGDRQTEPALIRRDPAPASTGKQGGGHFLLQGYQLDPTGYWGYGHSSAPPVRIWPQRPARAWSEWGLPAHTREAHHVGRICPSDRAAACTACPAPHRPAAAA